MQGRYEADACMQIREKLWEQGCNVPLVADIHFAPAVALRVADAFEKVRINPGNFADGKKSFENKVYDTRVRLVSKAVISIVCVFTIVRIYNVI